jgi:hypothetical protein
MGSIFWLSVLCVGCAQHPTFTGNVEFRNTSKVEIWVDSISGVPGIPPCGILGPDGSGKTVVSVELHLPAHATIAWSEGPLSYTNPNSLKYTNTISVDAITNCRSLLFELTTNHVWKVVYGQPSE